MQLLIYHMTMVFLRKQSHHSENHPFYLRKKHFTSKVHFTKQNMNTLLLENNNNNNKNTDKQQNNNSKCIKKNSLACVSKKQV